MGVNIFIISEGFFKNMFESVNFEMNLVNIVMLIVIGEVLFFFEVKWIFVKKCGWLI